MTVELALGLPVLVLLVAVVLVTTAAGLGTLRCADAARTAARVAALGQTDVQVVEAARRVAGPAARVGVRRDGGWVEVEVTASAVGGWFTGGPLAITGTATAWAEP
ncbi:TadE family type IV pilus minor pilin [Actinotalea sp.]|uniref:TadE family type IV pilus minor pilin n=1 Tax=Actinotalea sp. TaxID=1872145 RepID=UPI0035646A87